MSNGNSGLLRFVVIFGRTFKIPFLKPAPASSQVTSAGGVVSRFMDLEQMIADKIYFVTACAVISGSRMLMSCRDTDFFSTKALMYRTNPCLNCLRVRLCPALVRNLLS